MLRMCYNCKYLNIYESSVDWYNYVTPAEVVCAKNIMTSFNLDDWTDRSVLRHLETAMDCNQYEKVNE